MNARLKELIQKLARYYGYRIERYLDYTEHEIDVFRLLIERLEPADPDFFFLQVGAHDGRSGDPIHQFVKNYRWRGLLLEPQPDVFQDLVENYCAEPQLILENAALAHEDGTLILYSVPGNKLLASFDRRGLTNRVGDPSKIVETPVRARTLETLTETHGIKDIDLLVVDTEGFDFEVIKLVFRSGFFPPLLRYEHLHLSSEDRSRCASFLVSHGYKLLRDGPDTMALRMRDNRQPVL